MARRRLRGRAGWPGAVIVGTSLGLAAAACSGGSTVGTSSSSTTSSSAATSSSTTSSTARAGASAIDPTAIPLGDGHVGSSPRVGYVDSCVTSFGGGGGAQGTGPWLNSAKGTWSSRAKISVEGSVSWPAARYSATVSGSSRVVSTADLPTDHTTGNFPISPNDPAYRYDRNPNSIQAQSLSWSMPLDPQAAATPQCLGLGPIGVLDDGVLLFDALDAEGRDAGAHEIQDACGEHPQGQGVLHHHVVPSCVTGQATGSATLVGYAADGYGIYVERDSSGQLPTNADLDACHGRTSAVPWNGRTQDVYHYDATLEYPYTIGCYHATPVQILRPGG